MWFALDERNGLNILAINVKDNYKDTYNNSLRFKCIECKDVCTFVNAKTRIQHFRHLCKEKKCGLSHNGIEFNNSYYFEWYNYFKPEFRKPYWFNYKLEEISNQDVKIMIRYSLQSKEIITNVEKYSTTSKIIWILSLEKRQYNKIIYENNKFYMDFRGFKNDIPIYDNSKSLVYLDTGYDVLIKVNLNNWINKGQEVEFVKIDEFYKLYSNLFLKCPERDEWDELTTLLQSKYEIDIRNFKIDQNILLEAYQIEPKKLIEFDRIINEQYNTDFIKYIKHINDIKQKQLWDYQKSINDIYQEYINEIKILKEYDNIIYEYLLKLVCCINGKYYCPTCNKKFCRGCYLKKMKGILCCFICGTTYQTEELFQPKRVRG